VAAALGDSQVTKAVYAAEPRVRDDRDTPLLWDETAADMPVIWGKTKQKYFLLWE
jgi:hypothetical protein